MDGLGAGVPDRVRGYVYRACRNGMTRKDASEAFDAAIRMLIAVEAERPGTLRRIDEALSNRGGHR